jgi:hypothetical protein
MDVLKKDGRKDHDIENMQKIYETNLIKQHGVAKIIPPSIPKFFAHYFL